MPAVAYGAPKAAEVAEKTLNAYYYAQNDARAEIHMRLVNKDGREKIRDFTMLRLDGQDSGEQFYYSYFHNPPDVRRTVFMVWKHMEKDDDRWLYLPAIDLPSGVEDPFLPASGLKDLPLKANPRFYLIYISW